MSKSTTSAPGKRNSRLHRNSSGPALAVARRAIYWAMGLSAGLLALGVLALLTQRSRGSGPVATATVAAGPTLLTYSIVAEYPHDPQAFTQGVLTETAANQLGIRTCAKGMHAANIAGIQFDRECTSQSSDCVDIYWESTGRMVAASHTTAGVMDCASDMLLYLQASMGSQLCAKWSCSQERSSSLLHYQLRTLGKDW
jgi:hypothetical protein